MAVLDMAVLDMAVLEMARRTEWLEPVPVWAHPAGAEGEVTAPLLPFARMDLSPQAELFTTAVSIMAESPGAIQQRINRAYLAALSKVEAAEVENDLRPRVEALVSRLGATPMTRTMLTDDEGAAVAKEVVALAFEMCHREGARPGA